MFVLAILATIKVEQRALVAILIVVLAQVQMHAQVVSQIIEMLVIFVNVKLDLLVLTAQVVVLVMHNVRHAIMEFVLLAFQVILYQDQILVHNVMQIALHAKIAKVVRHAQIILKEMPQTFVSVIPVIMILDRLSVKQ